MTKTRHWEGIAVDLVYQSGKEAETIKILPKGMPIPDLQDWMEENIDRSDIKEPFFVYTYYVTIH